MFLTTMAWIVFVVTGLLLVIGVASHISDLKVNEIRKRMGMRYATFDWSRFFFMVTIFTASGWYLFDYL